MIKSRKVIQHYPCVECPTLGKHVHLSEKIQAIPDDMEYLEVVEYDGKVRFSLQDSEVF